MKKNEYCHRCGSLTDKDLRAELRKTKAELKRLRLSVASHVAKAAGLAKKMRTMRGQHD